MGQSQYDFVGELGDVSELAIDGQGAFGLPEEEVLAAGHRHLLRHALAQPVIPVPCEAPLVGILHQSPLFFLVSQSGRGGVPCAPATEEGEFPIQTFLEMQFILDLVDTDDDLIVGCDRGGEVPAILRDGLPFSLQAPPIAVFFKPDGGFDGGCCEGAVEGGGGQGVSEPVGDILVRVLQGEHGGIVGEGEEVVPDEGGQVGGDWVVASHHTIIIPKEYQQKRIDRFWGVYLR